MWSRRGISSARSFRMSRSVLWTLRASQDCLSTDDVPRPAPEEIPMKIYNSATHQKEDFRPIEEGKVRMYVCGPTVYDNIHIGNARTFISFDVIRRWLIASGYEVTFAQNLTDVDDKIINRANEQGRTAEEVATEFSDKFIGVMRAANVLDPDVRPRATKEDVYKRQR